MRYLQFLVFVLIIVSGNLFAQNFTIIGLPDTQYYTSRQNGGSPEIFKAQTQWIVDHRDSLNIVYVAHFGDCVENGNNNGNDIEWRNADTAIRIMEEARATEWPDGIPYGIAVGNHDQSPDGDPNGASTTFYNRYFGTTRFAGRSYYGGHFESNNDNHFDLFSASGLDFIVIYLEYDMAPDAKTLAWADSLLKIYPTRRAIVVSHFILWGDGPPSTFSDQGYAIYEALKDNSNLFLLLGGHEKEEGRRKDVFEGQTIYSLLADYQFRPNGGDGWLRIMELSPAKNEIQVKTYSPILDRYETDDNSDFKLFYDMTGEANRVKAYTNKAKLITNDAAGDYFGRAISISGDYAIIGSCFDNEHGEKSGSAYIFKRKHANWIQQAKLAPNDGTQSRLFGHSVSVSGDYAIVGAPGDTQNGEKTGAAYIFKRQEETWIQQDKLTAMDGTAGDFFGISVAISGDYAMVGTESDDDNGIISGSAYIFKCVGEKWEQQGKLAASDGNSNVFFGNAVSLAGEYAIVGAYFDNYDKNKTGAAYIFKREGEEWKQQEKLTASTTGQLSDYFGLSVSIVGDYAIVGAYGENNATGSAYIFKREGARWIEQQKLTASDGAPGDFFGYSVAIGDYYAIVGAHGDDELENDVGAVYVYQRIEESWIQKSKITAFDGAAGDFFGRCVAMDKNYIIVGTDSSKNKGQKSGSAYIYNIPMLWLLK